MTSIKCPRCSSAIAATPDALGLVVCPSCGVKLRSRTPSVVKVQGTPPPPAPVQPASNEPGTEIDSVLARLEAPHPGATLPPGTPLKKIPRPGGPQPAPAEGPTTVATLDLLLAEIRSVRRAQQEILELLRGGTAGEAAPAEASASDGSFTPLDESALEPELPAPVVRSRRRKTVLLIDDDERSRQAAVDALERAQVPVKTAPDGNSGLASIALEKPDVIAIELDIGGSMPGKDVINMIKATMEWVDIPIVLYTRLAVENQKEARTTHGADEYVLKTSGGPDALVAKIVMLFRKG